MRQAENELLTRVGAGTAMGALLGERLVVFRAKNGSAGLVGKYCPHRRILVRPGQQLVRV